MGQAAGFVAGHGLSDSLLAKVAHQPSERSFIAAGQQARDQIESFHILANENPPLALGHTNKDVVRRLFCGHGIHYLIQILSGLGAVLAEHTEFMDIGPDPTGVDTTDVDIGFVQFGTQRFSQATYGKLGHVIGGVVGQACQAGAAGDIGQPGLGAGTSSFAKGI